MRLTIQNSALFFASVSLLLVGGCGGGGSAANIEPTVRITSPPDGAQFTEGIFVTFRCAATDPEDGILAGASLVWQSSLDGQIGAGQSCTDDDLSLGTHIVTLTATDSGGASASDSITVHIRLPNQPPTASITSPTHGTTFSYGSPVAFQGTAVDPEDGALTGPSLAWTSNLDGGIGVGESFALNDLSVGYHTITLTATDSEGASASDSVTIRIRLPNQPPAATITSPSDGATFVQGDPVLFEAGVTDPEDGVLSGASLVWTSSLQGDIGTGEAFARNDLSVGTHTITLTATDSEGASASDSISIEIEDEIEPGAAYVYLLKTDANGALEWERVLAGGSWYWAGLVDQTTEGGYVIGCTTTSGPSDILLLKTYSTGILEWQASFGGAQSEEGASVQQTADGGYILAGETFSFGAGSGDLYLVKTDHRGSLEWQKAFGGTYEDEGFSVRQTVDGGYVIAGATESFGGGSDDAYLVKTDAAGELEWQKSFGGDSFDTAHSVCLTTDGGYVFTGVTASFAGEHVYLVKTDSSGELEWQKSFGGDYWGMSVQQTSDGGYVIAGGTDFPGMSNQSDVFLTKTDSLGNLIWEKTFGGPGADWGCAASQTIDGGYIVAGWADYDSRETADAYLIKTDSLGNIVWERTFGGAAGDWATSVQQTTDGGYVVAGWTQSFSTASGCREPGDLPEKGH